MRSLAALILAAACALARPPGPEPTPSPNAGRQSPYRRPVPPLTAREYVGAFFYDRYMAPHFRNERVRGPAVQEQDWLSKEIERISQMQDEEDNANAYDMDVPRWMARESDLGTMLDSARIQEEPSYEQNSMNSQLAPPQTFISSETQIADAEPNSKESDVKEQSNIESPNQSNDKFALTPLDKGYFDFDPNAGKASPLPVQEHVMHEGGGNGKPQAAMLLEPPRQIRQNPLSRSKTLVSENLDRLRSGLSHEEGHSTDRPRHVHVLETASDPAESIYGVALIAAIGAAITMAVFGFAIGWYTLFKKGKAAADVDYPAYGVTGPTIDTSGDRKLAHSAHMYHYQHQKQQIIAMERNGLEQRNGSISDPESEEENEEGDYTVYECPGFATTGDMEVKNPLFTEDPTPTPGKCEVVKPQPKD
ncbi:protein cab-1 isoform X2 [Amyelois transitella]|uniref:protein cab-1 isoform X2 n=1 Tax=Amyelois transitella TaxID=680683 RepID=UPI00067D84EF|nr:protein cab-1 isoform X2 [Amyelois transitella]